MSNAVPLTADEVRDIAPEIKETLEPLSSVARAQLEAEWEQIEREARRRGRCWGVADILSEWAGPQAAHGQGD